MKRERERERERERDEGMDMAGSFECMAECRARGTVFSAT
jgi:hypothetical protein